MWAIIPTMAITPARQRTAVSQGAALGLVLQGRTVVSAHKVTVDLAFEGSWRNWQYADRFPRVTTDLGKGLDGVHALTHATESRRGWVLYWETGGGELMICSRDRDWDPNDEGDVAYATRMIDGDVPAEGWASLAADLLARLGEEDPEV